MTYQKLKDKAVVPPGRFRFTVPENGTKIEGYLSMSSLLEAVQAHYQSNSIPLPDDWQGVVEDQLCRQLPTGFCTYNGQIVPGRRPIISAEGIIHGIKSLGTMLFERLKGGDVFVDQNEANQRAEICARCYNNMTTNFCAGCAAMREITSLVAKVKGSRSTPLDSKLLTCGVCGCRNEAIVHVKKEILLSGEPNETTNQRPDWCWLKTDNLSDATSQLKI